MIKRVICRVLNLLELIIPRENLERQRLGPLPLHVQLSIQRRDLLMKLFKVSQCDYLATHSSITLLYIQRQMMMLPVECLIKVELLLLAD